MHDRVTILMSLVLDGVATPAEKLRLDEHLATCPSCAAIWKQWQSVDELLSTAPEKVPSHNLTEEILAQLGERRRQSQFLQWLPLGLLVLCVLWVGFSLLAVVLFVWWPLRHPVDVGVMLSLGAQLLSGVSWFLRGIQMLMSGLSTIGTVGTVIAWMSCLTTGGALVALWLWLTQRSSSWARGAVPGSGSSRNSPLGVI